MTYHSKSFFSFWNEAQLELKSVRHFGDLVLTAFFGEDRPNSRETKRREYANLVTHDRADSVRVSLSDMEHQRFARSTGK